MTPADWPRDEPLDEKLLVIHTRARRWKDARMRDLPDLIRSGDLLVVNDAATVPASLPAFTSNGQGAELRLASDLGDARWRAVLFGEGDWRTRTEYRALPPALVRGDELRFAADLSATIDDVDETSPRLVSVRFSRTGVGLWRALYEHGRPIQYAHVARPLELWHVQTPFAARPWAVEMPSAGRAMVWALIAALRRRGVAIAPLTHAAGLSSTGDSTIDARLPLPERFDLPAGTVRAIEETRARGGRIVAVGTTVVRALEGCAAMNRGELVAGEAITDLRIGAGSHRHVVDGLITGLHEVGSSHRQLLRSFAPEALLSRAWAHAESKGYLDHEFGDACLVLEE